MNTPADPVPGPRQADWLTAALWLIHDGRAMDVHPTDANALVHLGLARWGADREVHITTKGRDRLHEHGA